MADSNEEIIGGIGVSITGDYSSLAASYSSAQDQAETAGKNIADAFNEGVSGVSDAAGVVTEALSGIGPAGDDAAGGLDTLSESAGHAGEAAHEAESGLAAMAEQLAAVGEALVITEGLRELGAEALGAADAITHASIALTTITGSGETAKETIEGLESLGMQDGLAMPSLLTAATRMQQLLGPGADVVGLLGTIANGAAAMGTDIGTAADMFDRMAANGQVMARSLGSVGLTMQGLADAVNQVNPSLNATAVNLTTVFKTMDQADRITALQTAFQGLGGVAEKVADQTFGGQWQQLANAWEGIMVQVGQAILPVISDILELTKTDIVPFLQDVVGAFNSLSEPMKDTVVALGLAAAAIIPVTGGLAALGLAFAGLQGLLPAVTGLLEAFGIGAAEVATEEVAATVATEGLGAAAVGAEAGVVGLAGVVAGALAAAITGGAALWVDYQDRMNAARATLQGISDSDLKTFLANIADVSQGTGNAGTATEQWEAKLATLKTALDIGAISATQYAAAVKLIEAAQDALQKQNLADSISGWTSGLTILTGATAKATDSQTILNQVLQDAQAKLAQVAAQYQAGTATAEQYLSASNSVASATTKVKEAHDALANSVMNEAIEQAKSDQETQVAVAGMEDWLTTSEAIVPIQKQQLAALQDLSAVLPPLVAQFAGLDGQITALQSVMPGFGVIMTSVSSGPLTGLQNALDEAKGKVAALAAQMADGANVGMQYEKALTAQLNAQIALDTESATLATGLQGATDAVSLATIAVADAQAKYNDLVTAWQAGQPVLSQLQSAQKALTTAQTELTTATNNQTSAVDVLSAAYPNLAAAAPPVVAGLNSISAAAAAATGQLQTVAQAVNSIAADMASAFGTGSKGGTAGGPGWTVTAGTPGISGGSAWYTPNVTQAQLQGMIDTGGATPQQIANTEAAMNALGYSDSWTFTWPGGFSGTAAAAIARQVAGGSPAATVGTASGGAQQSPIIVSGTVAGTTASAGTTAASTAPVATASGGGTSAVDGGSYPAVTAHQASGEVWAVNANGVASGAGAGVSSSISQQISTVINQSGTTGDLSGAISAVGGTVTQLTGISGMLGPITTSLATIAAEISKAVSGTATQVNGPTTYQYTATGGGGTAAPSGPPAGYFPSGNPQGGLGTVYNTPPATPPSLGSGANPFGPTSTGGAQVTVNIDARGSMGLNAQQMSQTIIAQVTQQLFTNGARITR